IRPSRRSLRQAQAKAANGDDERGFFAALARFTQRWPVPVALVTVAILLAAGMPLLRLNPTIPNLDGLPNSVESVAVSKQLVDQYDQVGSAVVRVVARTDAETLDDWAARWTADPAVSRVEPADAVGDVSVVTLVLRGEDQDAAARELVERVRADRPPGVQSWVTGQAALLIDVLDVLARNLPWAAALAIVAMLVLLFLMTGSIVVPIKAIIMGVLSLGASFGVLVLLFQD